MTGLSKWFTHQEPAPNTVVEQFILPNFQDPLSFFKTQVSLDSIILNKTCTFPRILVSPARDAPEISDWLLSIRDFEDPVGLSIGATQWPKCPQHKLTWPQFAFLDPQPEPAEPASVGLDSGRFVGSTFTLFKTILGLAQHPNSFFHPLALTYLRHFFGEMQYAFSPISTNHKHKVTFALYSSRHV